MNLVRIRKFLDTFEVSKGEEGEGLPQELRLQRGGREQDSPYSRLKPGPGKDAGDVARNQRGRIRQAMLELVAERGFDAVTVRELAARSGVSTRTFYQCYSGKEDCFLRVHEMVARRLLRDLSNTGAESNESRVGLERTVVALVAGLDRDLAAAHLLLVDSHTAGARAGVQVRRALRSIEDKIGASLAEVDGPSSSSLISESLTAGLLGLAASRLLREPKSPLRDLVQGLSDWARVLDDVGSLRRLEELGARTSAHAHAAQARPPISSSDLSGRGRGDVDGDVSLLLSSAAKLIAGSDHEPSSTKILLRTAGVSRRSFDERFASLEECVLTAIQLRGEAAVTRAELAGLNTPDPASRVVRIVASLCAEVAGDPELASLCFGWRAFESVAKLRRQDRVRERFARTVSALLETQDGLQIETSVASMWGVLRGQVSRGRASTAASLTPLLAYIVLAPSLGRPEAMAAVLHECASTGPEFLAAAKTSIPSSDTKGCVTT